MDADQLIVESANSALAIIGSEKFVRLTEAGLGAVAGELRRHIQPEDEPGMLLVVDPMHVPKAPVGYILVLKGRTILVWSVGLRPRPDSVVIPIDSDDQIVQAGTIPKTWRQPEKFIVDLVGPPTYRVEIFNEGNMAGALNLARGIATGWATLT